MNIPVLEVEHAGLGGSLQDRGRFGWRRYGVPPSGAMDDHAAAWANKLLENPPDVPLLELRIQGARLRALKDFAAVITGADTGASVPLWQVIRLARGDVIEFTRNRSGVWTYLAVEGGFGSAKILNSCSVYARGRLGSLLQAGDILSRVASKNFQFPAHIAGRMVAWDERRNYEAPPLIRVWPGPQWALFSDAERSTFFQNTWEVTSQSDRVGYRLNGLPFQPRSKQIISEPVRVGSIQIPDSGMPIITMRDGPAVGGYPKLGVIDPRDLSWVTQCRAGQKLQFQAAG